MTEDFRDPETKESLKKYSLIPENFYSNQSDVIKLSISVGSAIFETLYEEIKNNKDIRDSFNNDEKLIESFDKTILRGGIHWWRNFSEDLLHYIDRDDFLEYRQTANPFRTLFLLSQLSVFKLRSLFSMGVTHEYLIYKLDRKEISFEMLETIACRGLVYNRIYPLDIKKDLEYNFLADYKLFEIFDWFESTHCSDSPNTLGFKSISDILDSNFVKRILL